MAKDGNQPENTIDTNPAHQTDADEGLVQRNSNLRKGPDTTRGSEGDRRRAGKGAR